MARTSITKTSSKSLWPHSPFGIILVLSLLFLFRLAFGLCSDIRSDDPRQTYLIGLKYFCTDSWPYFGPDVIEGMQVPGSLEGLMVGGPLKFCPWPEAPYMVLNLLSFGALGLLAWYFSKRLPGFPRWILWGWLMTAPWTLDCSTNIFNISYVLLGSVLFFVGFLESVPALSLRAIPFRLCYFMMGFALFWIAQFHLSYVILVPFVLFSLFSQIRIGFSQWVNAAVFLLIGCFTTGVFLLPTYLQYGFHQGAGGTQSALAFNPSNFLQFFTILARYLSLASCEIPRFIGAHTPERLAFLKNYPWAAPFTIVAGLLGMIQPLIMLFSGLIKKHPQKDWRALRLLTFLTFLLLYISFLFTFKSPASHTYYLTLPLVMLYAFYVFGPWAYNRWFLLAAKTLLICNLVFHVGLAADNFKNKSLYQERALFIKAIQEKNFHLVAERRNNSLY